MTDRKIYSIEGLRALAVLAVIAFHLWPGTFPGGFLGVDLFFVISGYVITSLLAEQVRAKGELNFKNFYNGRLRRLAPAIAVVAGVSLFLTSLFNKDLKGRGLSDLAFIFTGTYNWHLSMGDVSYFDQWSPPLFQHLWSLSVETQYYTLWPLIFFGLTFIWSSRQIARNLGLLSLGLSVWLISGDIFGTTNLSGHYFTTHLHMISLVVGSALAFVWRPEFLSAFVAPQARKAINNTAWSALFALALMIVFVNEKTGQSIYVLIALIGGLLLTLAVHPASTMSRVLSIPLLVEIGRRSYSLYLWHWPIILLVPKGWIHAPLSILATVVLSELSFRYIEEPFRTGNFHFTLPRLGYRLTPVLPTAFLLIGITFAAVLTPQVSTPAQGVVNTAAVADDGVEAPTTTDSSTVPPPVSEPSSIKTSVFIGDSVLLGARSQVPDAFNLRIFDGVVGRQAPEVLAALKRVSPDLREGLVVINLGNNGTMSEVTTKWIFEQLKSFKYSVIINTHVPRSWQDPNNELIDQFAARYQTVKVADWEKASRGHPEYFGSDGVHLTPVGQKAYMATVRGVLN